MAGFITRLQFCTSIETITRSCQCAHPPYAIARKIHETANHGPQFKLTCNSQFAERIFVNLFRRSIRAQGLWRK